MKNSAETGSKRELAELLSGVLKHPELSERLCKKIGDEIIELSSNMDFDSADVIELILVENDSNVKNGGQNEKRRR